MTTLQIINLAIMLAFFLCYSYQFFYIPVAWWKKDAPHREPSPHRIAVLIAARNEQSVIGNLIDSVKAQDYPTELVDVFVVADNCTDLTGSVAGAHGANVYFRNDQTQVGKGYALQYLLHCIEEDFAPYDGYLVLDADNVLSPDYITEINKTFSDGYQIVTSYRNSKNYGDNWISAGYALWFLRESRYLNGALLCRQRHRLPVLSPDSGKVRRLELLPADRGYPVHHCQCHPGRKGGLLPHRRPL